MKGTGTAIATQQVPSFSTTVAVVVVYSSSWFSCFFLGFLALFRGFLWLRRLNQSLNSLKWQENSVSTMTNYFAKRYKVNTGVHPSGFPQDLDGRIPSFSRECCVQRWFPLEHSITASSGAFCFTKPPWTGVFSPTCRPAGNSNLGPFSWAYTARKTLKIRAHRASSVLRLILHEILQKLQGFPDESLLGKAEIVR